MAMVCEGRARGRGWSEVRGAGGGVGQECAQSSAEVQGRKRKRAGARQAERAVRVEGLGEVVVCSAGGVVLRLRHVVATRKRARRESVVGGAALSRYLGTDEGNNVWKYFV